MFSHTFMIIAFAVGLMLSVIIPLIGSSMVFKRLSLTGDALSHTSLAGVAIGLIMGYSPVVIAIIVCILAGLIIELIRKKFYKYSEISIAVVLSGGVGLAAVLSSFTPMNNFSTYLFGSIVAITGLELYLTIGLFVVVLTFYLLFYKELMHINYSEESAKIANIKVNALNIISTILTAVTVAIAARTVGALIVSSLMVVPLAASMQIAANYKQTIAYSVLFAALSTFVGLTCSFYLGIRPGGAIVLICVLILVICMLGKFIAGKVSAKKMQ